MMKLKQKAVLLSGALALAFGATPVAASSDAENRADAQCLALFTMVFAGDDAQSMDESAQAGGMVLVGYYLGRLEQRTPDLNLSTLMTDVITVDLADASKMEDITTRCTAEAQSIAERLGETGAALTAIGQ